MELTTSEIVEIVKRHKRGVRLLDRKVPHWRRTMRTHQGQYRFSSPDHCVVGTLARHSPALRQKLRTICFDDAVRVLTGKRYDDINDPYSAFGFDAHRDDTYQEEMDLLHVLWRTEFES